MEQEIENPAPFYMPSSIIITVGAVNVQTCLAEGQCGWLAAAQIYKKFTCVCIYSGL